MKLVSSTDKIKAMFKIIDGLDDLDKNAFAKLIRTAEIEIEEEIATTNKKAVEEAEIILNDILPLVRLARLEVASKTISPFQRTVIVKYLMQEFLWLLTPVEAAGTLQAMIYDNFDQAKPKLVPVMIMPRQDIQQEREDESRTIV